MTYSVWTRSTLEAPWYRVVMCVNRLVALAALAALLRQGHEGHMQGEVRV